MSDELKLPESGSEGTWDIDYTYKSKTIPLTLTEDLVKQEIYDQCSLKKPARKAILRATEKRLAKSLKFDFTSLNQDKQDEIRWDTFIVFINDQISDRHLMIREDANLASEILNSASVRGPSSQTE